LTLGYSLIVFGCRGLGATGQIAAQRLLLGSERLELLLVAFQRILVAIDLVLGPNPVALFLRQDTTSHLQIGHQLCGHPRTAFLVQTLTTLLLVQTLSLQLGSPLVPPPGGLRKPSLS